MNYSSLFYLLSLFACNAARFSGKQIIEILAHALAAERKEFLARSGVSDNLLSRSDSWIKWEAENDVGDIATVIDVILNPSSEEDDGIEVAIKDRQAIESRLKNLDRIGRRFKRGILWRFSRADAECSLSFFLETVFPYVPQYLREFDYRLAVDRPLSLRRIMRALYVSLANDVKFPPQYDSVVSEIELEAPPPSYPSLFRNDFVRSEARVIHSVIARDKEVTDELISLMLSNFEYREAALLPDDYISGAAIRLAKKARHLQRKI
jgi:hypothetical protein